MENPIRYPINTTPPTEPPTAAPMIVPVLDFRLGIGVCDEVFVARGGLRVEDLEDVWLEAKSALV